MSISLCIFSPNIFVFHFLFLSLALGRCQCCSEKGPLQCHTYMMYTALYAKGKICYIARKRGHCNVIPTWRTLPCMPKERSVTLLGKGGIAMSYLHDVHCPVCQRKDVTLFRKGGTAMSYLHDVHCPVCQRKDLSCLWARQGKMVFDVFSLVQSV